jgi:putative ABC transport system permease protein
MIRFILADLRRHWIGAVAVTLIIALATALGVVVTLQERGLRLGSARAAAAFDLVIGAPGSETQLVLSSVFLQTEPLPLVPGSVLAGLLADARVAWAAPIGFGDQIDGQPIIGTTQALLDGFGGVKDGQTFTTLGEAVVGADVPMAIGATFYPVHAAAQGSGHVHDRMVYRISGRLGKTGTPWDRAVLVPIETVWQIHGMEEAEEGEEHNHAHGHALGHKEGQPHGEVEVDIDAPIQPDAVTRPGAPGLPAILVKPRAIADAYKLRQEYRGEGTLAVFPAEVLTRLYRTLGDAKLVLSGIAIGAQGLVAAAILLVVMVHVVQRRRQIGALRAFGAPRPVIFAIVWIEIFVMIGAGLLVGFGIGYGAARLIADLFARTSGVPLPIAFIASDAISLSMLLVVSGLIALLPALLAYRQSPTSALRA